MPSVAETAVANVNPIEDDAEDIALRAQLEASPDATLEKVVADEPEPAKPEDPEETTVEDPPKEEDKPEAKEPDPIADNPNDSKFVRKRKEVERLEKTWAAANARKAELDAREARLAATEQQRTQTQAPKPEWKNEEEIDLTPPKPKFRGNKIVHGDQEYGVKELTAVVENSLANGDIEGAKQIIAVRDKLIQRDTLYQFHQAEAQGEQRFNEEINQAISARPSLSDPNDPVAKIALEIHKGVGSAFKRIPGGFNMIVQAAEAYVKAARVEAAETRATKAEARVKELEGKTGLVGAPPSKKASGSKSADDMDDEELESAARAELETRLANRY